MPISFGRACRSSFAFAILSALCLPVLGGCKGDTKTAGSVGSAGPSLEAKDPAERAAAARDAAKKYGASPDDTANP